MYAISARLTRGSPNVPALYENLRAAIKLSPARAGAPAGGVDQDMLAFAEQAVMDAQEHAFEWLDYSVESLAQVDRWFDQLRSDPRLTTARGATGMSWLWLGAYLGRLFVATCRSHRNEPGLPRGPAVSTGGSTPKPGSDDAVHPGAESRCCKAITP
jgi:hypothetical protein